MCVYIYIYIIVYNTYIVYMCLLLDCEFGKGRDPSRKSFG